MRGSTVNVCGWSPPKKEATQRMPSTLAASTRTDSQYPCSLSQTSPEGPSAPNDKAVASTISSAPSTRLTWVTEVRHRTIDRLGAVTSTS